MGLALDQAEAAASAAGNTNDHDAGGAEHNDSFRSFTAP